MQKDKTNQELKDEIKLLRERIAEPEMLYSDHKRGIDAAEKKFSIIFDNITDGVVITDLETKKFNDANKSMCKLLGYSLEELKALGVADIHPKEQLPYIIEQIDKQSKDPLAPAVDHPVTRKDGSVFYANILGTKMNLFGKDYMVAIFRDITERKNIEDLLRIRENQYRALFEQSNDAIFIADPDTRALIDCNAAAMEMTGYTKKEILSMREERLHPKDAIDKTMEIFKKQALGTKVIVYAEALTKAGDITPVSIHSSFVEIDGKTRLMAAFRDVSEIKKQGEAIRNSEALLKGIVTAVPVGLGVASGRVIQWANDHLFYMAGLQKEEVVGKNSRIFYESEEEFIDVGKRFYADLSAKNTAEIETFWKHKDGRILNIYLTGVMLNPGKTDQSIIFCALDITERKRAEEALRESEKRFMDVLYASQDAIILIDDNIFMACNEAAAKMLGYPTRKELLMTHPSKLSPETQPDGRKSFEKAEEMIKIALEKGYNRFEWIHRKASGEDFLVEVSFTPITLYGRTVIHCLWRDLTEPKKTEKAERAHLKELEVFHKASVGREERILELKKKVTELEKKLKEA